MWNGHIPRKTQITKAAQEEIENVNKTITSKKIKLVCLKFSINISSPGPEEITGEFYQPFKELIPIFHKLLGKLEEEEILFSSFLKQTKTSQGKKNTKQYPLGLFMQKPSTKY